MNDEIGNQSSQEPELVKASPKTRRKKMGKLDVLPSEMQNELNRLVGEKLSPKSIRDTLLDKFPLQAHLLPKTKDIFMVYIKKYESILEQQKGSGTSLVTIAQEVANDLQTIGDIVLSPSLSLDNKKEAFASLYERLGKRLAFLEKKSTTEAFNPIVEATILGHYREMRTIIERLTTLKHDLDKDLGTQFLQEMENYSRMILTIVYQCAKEIYGEDKFGSFHASVGERVEKALTNYKTAKDQQKGA